MLKSASLPPRFGASEVREEPWSCPFFNPGARHEPFVRPNVVVRNWLWGYLLVVSGSAQAQPNSAGWQAAQAHATAQQATNHAMQQHWHNQRVMQTSRQLQDFSSGQGGGQRFHQPGAGLQVWRPGDRFRSDDLALEFDRLANVDYRSLSPAERGQFKAACRKFRLAVNHGYVYR